jgi:hypothetical protein
MFAAIGASIINRSPGAVNQCAREAIKVRPGMIGWRNGRFLILTLAATALAAALHGQTRPEPAQALRSGFRQPPASAKMRCYWWWLNGNTTTETITSDLEAMKDKGFAGAILVDADGSGQQGNLEVPMGPAIGSPQWMSLYLHALKEAQRLGLEISLNVTSRWNVGIIGGPTVQPADAMKLLAWSRTEVEGGGQKAIRLDAPAEVNGFYRPIAVLAYPLHHGATLAGSAESGRAPIRNLDFKTASLETGFSMTPSERVMNDAAPTAGEQDTELGEVVDLSGKMDGRGNLEWNFPQGTWEVLRIGYTCSTKPLNDAEPPPQGLPLDALSAKAFDDYWRDAVAPLLDAAKPYLGKSLRYLVTDSWEAGGANWTDGFREEFRRRRGYDPVAYLPIVAGRIVTSRNASNRFLFDLRRTVADLIAENYYDRFAAYARKRGLGTHPEAGGPHGAPIDALRNFRSTTYPQTEFWVVSGTHRVSNEERFFVKEASSAAHIYGKPVAAAEGPTSMNPAAWSESLANDLQPTFDQALTEGLNRLFWHEFTTSPAKYGKPGQEYFAGTHINPNITWWNQAGPFLLAFNRAQFLMQQGKPVSDLLYFYGDQVPGFARVKSDDPAHLLPGYDYDVANEDALLDRMGFAGADLHTPEGVHYRALSLPSLGGISYPAIVWIERFVRQGGVVVGTKPAGPLGLISAEKQAEYARIADAMWAGCKNNATAAHYGRGRIYCTANARAAMSAEGVGPDFSYQLNGPETETPNGFAFDYIHRKTADAEIYFVRNTRSREIEATLSFRVRGRTPELWSADEGTTSPAAAYRQTAEGRTEIPLTFPANGSIFVIFARPSARHLVRIEKDGNAVFPSIRQGVGVFSSGEQQFVATVAGAYVATDSNGAAHRFTVQSADLEAPAAASWTLSFPAGWGAPQSIALDRFQSWTESAEPGIRYFSGTAIYRASLQVPADLLASGRELWLKLGEVREIATVKINGQAVETLWRQPFAARIDRQAHAGENTVEIEVTNLWPNRLIGDLQPSTKAPFTRTNVRAYTADSPLLPSGILEPVTFKTSRELRW